LVSDNPSGSASAGSSNTPGTGSTSGRFRQIELSSLKFIFASVPALSLESHQQRRFKSRPVSPESGIDSASETKVVALYRQKVQNVHTLGEYQQLFFDASERIAKILTAKDVF
jgi:hypothetical protein